MKNFVTIFEKCENIHLIKDVGQIPFLMHQYFGFNSKIVSYKNSDNYDYLNREVKGLRFKFIPKIKLGRYSLSILWYLFFNAKEIDVLHLFHHREKTYLNFLMYKWRNPKGIAFLKSDIGLNTLKEHYSFFSQIKRKYALRKWLLTKALSKIDIISIESEEGVKIIREKYRKYQEKFLLMPNGINIEGMHKLVPLKAFDDKENIILTVGRIGAKEKNNELLLSSIEKLELDDYKVVFIGAIEMGFQEKIDDFYKRNPQLLQKVIFTGAIYDRKELYGWYAKSKIFCLTSIEESFGFVLIEAMAYQNYIVTTPVSSAKEISLSGTLGSIVSSEDELVKTLTYLMKNDILLKEKSKAILEHVKDKFSWKENLQRLLFMINKKEGEEKSKKS